MSTYEILATPVTEARVSGVIELLDDGTDWPPREEAVVHTAGVQAEGGVRPGLLSFGEEPGRGRANEIRLGGKGPVAASAAGFPLLGGTPVRRNPSFELAHFETLTWLAFQVVSDVWAGLNAGATRRPTPQQAAYDAFCRLSQWLGLANDETATLVGIGRTTPYTWRDGREPQPRRARRLFETHDLVEALVEQLGVEDARAVLRRGGRQSPLRLIAKGRVADAEDQLGELIFRRAPRRDVSAWEPDGASELPAETAGEGLRQGRRVIDSVVPR